MLKLLEGTTGRLIRSAASLAAGAALAHNQNNPWLIAATPLIQAASKWARDKWPGYFEWLPF